MEIAKDPKQHSEIANLNKDSVNKKRTSGFEFDYPTEKKTKTLEEKKEHYLVFHHGEEDIILVKCREEQSVESMKTSISKKYGLKKGYFDLTFNDIRPEDHESFNNLLKHNPNASLVIRYGDDAIPPESIR